MTPLRAELSSPIDIAVIDEPAVLRLLAEFREKAEPLGVTVTRVASLTEAAREVTSWVSSMGSDVIIVATEVAERAPELELAMKAVGVRVRPSDSPEATRDAPVGLSLARLAVAETGSMLLCESSLEDRSVGMLTLAQAILCPTSALVASLDDAVPALRQRALAPGGAFSTLVTGPSRTADIERVLTVGVQGPGTVMTLFVDEW